MKKTFVAVVAALLVAGSPVSADDGGSGFVPPTSGPYSYIFVYYNETGQVAGWHITYCDGSTENVSFPGQNQITIDVIQGTCIPGLPF